MTHTLDFFLSYTCTSSSCHLSMMFNLFVVAGLLAGCVSGEYLRTESSSVEASACFCTTVPCPVAGANYLIEGGGSNGTYIYVNNQDGIPVVSSASVTITTADLNKGTDTTKCTQDYSRSMDDDGVKDCDAGHILANRLGGPGNQPINIFPQNLHINRGEYKVFEGNVYDCLTVGGATSGALSWTFTYATPTNTKPSKLTYKAVFKTGSCTQMYQEFTNEG